MEEPTQDTPEMENLLADYTVLCSATGFPNPPREQLVEAMERGDRQEFIILMRAAFWELACYGLEYSPLQDFWKQIVTNYNRRKQ